MLLRTLFFLSLALLVAASPLWPFSTAPAGEDDDDSSDNDVDDYVCRPVTLIFARGTFEPGNMGAIIGPPLLHALRENFGDDIVAAQGVSYRAGALGNLFSRLNPGIRAMADQVRAAVAQCGSTTVVLGGYSQGGLLVHGALKQLGAAQLRRVGAVVLFGDEGKNDNITQIPPSRVLEFCAKGDDICEKQNYVVRPVHLTYGADASAAAAFVKQVIGLRR